MSLQATIKSVLDEGGIDYKTNSKSFILTCPRCQKREKLYIRKNDGRFVCWVCRDSDGFTGSPEWVLAELLGQNVKEVKEQLYGNESQKTKGLYLDLQLIDFFDDEEDEIPEFIEPLPVIEPDPDFRAIDSEAGKDGRAYLESRGIPLSLALEYGIMYWPKKKRVVFPVKSHGQLLGWQDRYIEQTSYFDEELRIQVTIPKAITSIGLKRDHVLMFADRITEDHVILCEGPIDAIKAHACGGNVAAMGKAVSRQQLNLIRNSGITKLYIALDPDAFVESTKILNLMGDDFEIYDMRPPSQFGDLGAMSVEQVRQLYLSAPRITKGFLYLYLKDHYAIK